MPYWDPCMNSTEPLDIYAPRLNIRGGMIRLPAPPIGLKSRGSHDLCRDQCRILCPLRTPKFPTGTHNYDPKRHDLIEGVSKCMTSGQEAQAKFNEFREAKGSHDEVYTDGSKMNESGGSCGHQPPFPKWWDNLSPTVQKTSAPSLQLRLQPSVWHWTITNTWAQSITMWWSTLTQCSCLQAIEGEDTENLLICHIMNLLWSLSDKGTRVRFCWAPSHCGNNGNEKVDQLA